MPSLAMVFDHGAIDAQLDDLTEKAKAACRPAAQAGAQVFYNEVTLNVAAIGKKTGNLVSSIYQAFSKDQSTPQSATYHISWNHQKAPHGHLVEFGHIQTRKVYIGSDGNWYTSPELLPTPKQVGARPFIRPAYDSKAEQALKASRDVFVEAMQ